MNAVHCKQAITRLITGNSVGAEEMAYWRAAQKPIPQILTLPHTGVSESDVIHRHQNLCHKYQLNGIVVFGHLRGFDWLKEEAQQLNIGVWQVFPEIRNNK